MVSSRGLKRSASSTLFDLHHPSPKRTVKTEILNDQLTETKMKVKPVESITIDLTEDTPPNSPGLYHAIARFTLPELTDDENPSSSDDKSAHRQGEQQKSNDSTPAHHSHDGSDAFKYPGSEVPETPDAHTRPRVLYDSVAGDDEHPSPCTRLKHSAQDLNDEPAPFKMPKRLGTSELDVSNDKKLGHLSRRVQPVAPDDLDVMQIPLMTTAGTPKGRVLHPMINLIQDSPSSRHSQRTLESKSGQKRALPEAMAMESSDSAEEDLDYVGSEDDDDEDDDDEDDDDEDDDGEDDDDEDDDGEDDDGEDDDNENEEGEKKDVVRPRIRKSKLTISSIWDTVDVARPNPVVITVAGKRARKQSIAKYKSGDLVLGQYYTPNGQTPALLGGHEGLLTISQKVANVIEGTTPGSRRMLTRLWGTGLSLLQICGLGGFKDHDENTLEQWGKDIGLDTADLPTRNNPLQCYMDAQSLLRLFEYRLSGFDWHSILELFRLTDMVLIAVIRDQFRRHLVRHNGLKIWKAAVRHAQKLDKGLTNERVNDLFIGKRGIGQRNIWDEIEADLSVEIESRQSGSESPVSLKHKPTFRLHTIITPNAGTSEQSSGPKLAGVPKSVSSTLILGSSSKDSALDGISCPIFRHLAACFLKGTFGCKKTGVAAQEFFRQDTARLWECVQTVVQSSKVLQRIITRDGYRHVTVDELFAIKNDAAMTSNDNKSEAYVYFMFGFKADRTGLMLRIGQTRDWLRRRNEHIRMIGDKSRPELHYYVLGAPGMNNGFATLDVPLDIVQLYSTTETGRNLAIDKFMEVVELYLMCLFQTLPSSTLQVLLPPDTPIRQDDYGLNISARIAGDAGVKPKNFELVVHGTSPSLLKKKWAQGIVDRAG